MKIARTLAFLAAVSICIAPACRDRDNEPGERADAAENADSASMDEDGASGTGRRDTTGQDTTDQDATDQSGDSGQRSSDALDSLDDAHDTSAPSAIEVTQDDFDCILGWEKKRRFYIKNVAGSLDRALAIADSEDGGHYPPGTIIQLVPSEAMVKHGDGWAPETNNWEFFSLDPAEDDTEILDRGTTDVENQFGGNCLDCHSKAKPKWDFVCEQEHGCDPLPIGADTIETIQENDPRCP